ncbi:MAG: NADPH-dependent F420 reductase [Bacteroidales bacterium]
MKNKIGIIGSGQVAQVLADGFLKYSYEVMMGSRDQTKLEGWKAKNGDKAHIGSFQDAARFGEIVVLAVSGHAAEQALWLADIKNLVGKTVIDVTNPIAQEPPVNGVLKFFTDINESLMEKLQHAAPDARFVKAFSCVGNAFMINPDFPEGKPSMFICGNHEEARREVSEILNLFGWDVADMGMAEAARAIEPLCMLWCIPGFTSNSWNHAFKLLRK